MAEQQKQAQEQDINQLLKVRRKNYRHFRKVVRIRLRLQNMMQIHHSMEIKDQFEALEGKEVSVAGRGDAEACYGESFFLQRSGSSGYHTVLRGERQHRRRLL